MRTHSQKQAFRVKSDFGPVKHPCHTARGDFGRKKSFTKHQSPYILSWQQRAYLPYRPTQSARLRLLTKVLSILAIFGHRQGSCGRSRRALGPLCRASNRHSMGNTRWCAQPLVVNNPYGVSCTLIFENRPFMLKVTLGQSNTPATPPEEISAARNLSSSISH